MAWSVSVGPHGATVRVRERGVGGNVALEVWDADIGGTRSRSLGFKVRDADGDLIEENLEEAKKQAGRLSNRLIRGERPDRTLTVGDLADRFRREKLAELEGQHRTDTKRAITCWETFLGSNRPVQSVDVSLWEAFIRERGAGEIDASGQRVPRGSRTKVSDRTVTKDLKVLRQMCRWATRRRDGDSFLLDEDPTRGLEFPETPTPSRPVATDEQLEALLEAAPDIESQMREGEQWTVRRSYLRELLILAAATGRRIGAIVALRWSDWMPDRGEHGWLRWRADSDKLGEEWEAPVGSPTVADALAEQRRRFPGVAEAPVFPAPASEGAMSVDLASKWFRRAEKRADLWSDRQRPRFGWHALRRRWATCRKDLPAQDVAAVGGWRGVETLRTVYQHADSTTMERVAQADEAL